MTHIAVRFLQASALLAAATLALVLALDTTARYLLAVL